MNYRKSYLDYYQNILKKVSFDEELFWKEYKKANKFLNSQEQQLLRDWLVKQYKK